MRRAILILTMLACLAAGTAAARADAGSTPGRVELTIFPVRVEQGGDLLVALFSDEESWLKLDRAYAVQCLQADADTLVAVFTGVPHGSYAAEALHDKNRNGKFDMRWFPFPKPKEGAGVSHNNLRMGKPRYGPAVFEVGPEPVRLRIELRY